MWHYYKQQSLSRPFMQLQSLALMYFIAKCLVAYLGVKFQERKEESGALI